jgi:hypothetical protein
MAAAMILAAIDREQLGSAHDGEVAAATHAAHVLVKRAGLTWFEVLDPQSTLSAPGPEVDFKTVDEACTFCLRFPQALTAWEIDFCRLVQQQFRSLSDRQAAVLNRLIAKVQHTERRGHT